MERCFSEGLPLPKKIQNAPVPFFGTELYLTAFYDLDGDRPSGLEIQLIPWAAMKDYAGAYDIVGEQREDLFSVLRSVDMAYVKYIRKQNEAKRKRKAKK